MARTYALRLAEQGITAFTFDFTGFGKSGGAPRQLELPARKIADIAAAADFLSTMSFVTKGGVGHVGICASAQYTLAAIARGAGFRSFVSIAGWYHDADRSRPFTAAWREPGFGSAARERRSRRGRSPAT